jgi:hypothetical protein
MRFVPESPISAKVAASSMGGKDDLQHVPSRITTGFNLAMLAYLAITGLLGFLVRSAAAGGVPLAGLMLSTSIDMIRYLVVLLITAFILLEFWSRLVSPLVTIRLITYGESIAIVLMISILFHA